MTPAVVATAQLPCNPNISASGRRRRLMIGIGGWGAALAVAVAVVALQAPWYWRALTVAAPAMAGTIGWLQAQRFTCIARAREGTFEHDDASTTAMSEIDVRASRRVARSIVRDVLLVGLAAGTLAAATAILR